MPFSKAEIEKELLNSSIVVNLVPFGNSSAMDSSFGVGLLVSMGTVLKYAIFRIEK
jgi:hypothetical protein